MFCLYQEFYIYDSAGREPFADTCENMVSSIKQPKHTQCDPAVCVTMCVFVCVCVFQWNQPSLMCVVFDITSEASFTNCSRWIDRVRSHCNGLQVPGQRSRTHTYHTLTHINSQTHTHIVSLSHTHTHKHKHTQSFSHTHTDTHTHI